MYQGALSGSSKNCWMASCTMGPVPEGILKLEFVKVGSSVKPC